MELLLGAIVSLITSVFKKKFESEEFGTIIIAVVLSLITASVYYVLASVGYLDAVIDILIRAGAFYAFIIRRFK